MSDIPATPDSREDVFGRFFEELEEAADKEAVVRRYAAEHPRWAADFRAEAAIELLVHAKPAPGEPYPEGLPDFRIHRKVAEGGMGVVYEAEQLSLRRRVALKVRRQRLSPQAQKRFEREQETLARLHQTHIVPVHTAGQVGPWQYFAMAYIEGAPLHRLVQTALQRETAGHAGKTPTLAELASEMVRQGSEPATGGAGLQPAASSAEPRQVANLPHDRRVTLSSDYFRSVARVLADAAEALEHAHEKRILHRDVKPSNLMIDTDGKCWLIDFGLAYCNGNGKAATPPAEADQPSDAALTRGPLGTPGYMAPEQYREKAEVRSDVWGLGVTLYELLTLRPAFEGRTQEEVRAKVLAAEPTPMRELAEGVPADLVAICRKAMRKEPGQRYATAGEFAEDLRRWLRYEPTKARPVWVGRRVWLWARRNTGWAAALVMTLLTLAALVVLSVQSALTAETAKKMSEARVEAANAEIVAANARREAAEQKERDRHREVHLLRLQQLTMAAHTASWRKEADALIREIARIRVDIEARTHAAASLVGMDAALEKPFSWNVSSVAFSHDGKELLLGGYTDYTDSHSRPTEPARLWRGGLDDPIRANVPGSGPVAFRKDGTPLHLVADREDCFHLQLWEVAKQERVQTFRLAPKGPPPSYYALHFLPLALAPDGSRVAASTGLPNSLPDDRDGILRVWDAATGQELYKVEKRFTALAFSPDGTLLAGGDEDGGITVWALRQQGQEMTKFPPGGTAVRSLAFGRNPRRTAEAETKGTNWLLAAGDAGGTISVWDVGRPARQAICHGSRHDVHAVAFNRDGTLLASAGRVEAKLWDATTGKLLLSFKARNWMTGVTFSPDSKKLAVSGILAFGNPGGVDVWRLENGRAAETLRGLRGHVYKVVTSMDERYVAALSDAWEVALWDRAEGRLLHVLAVPPGYYTSSAALAFSHDGKQFAFSTKKRAVLWDVETGQQIDKWDLPPAFNDELAFDPTGKRLLSVRTETKGRQHPPSSNVDSQQHPRVCRARILLPGGMLQELREVDFPHAAATWNISPDASWFVVGGVPDRTQKDRWVIRILDGATGKQKLPDWSVTADQPPELLMAPSGKALQLSVRRAGRLTNTFVEMPSGKALIDVDDVFQIGQKYANVPVRPGGPPLLGRVSDKIPLLRGISGYGTASGKRLVQSTREGTVIVWDFLSLERQLTEVDLGW